MNYTHEHLEIQKTLKRFIDEEINPHVDEWEAAEIFPAHQVFKRLGELGLLGLTKPEEYGGAGLDYSYAMAMAEALGHIALRRRADGHRRADRHGHAGAGALRQRRAAKREFLAPAIAGDMVACIGVSEPGAGSDVAGIKSRARKDGDDYVITGQKMWITNSLQADWMCMLVNTGEGPVHKNKTLVIVPMRDGRAASCTKGIEVAQKIRKIGMNSLRHRPDLFRRGAGAAALPHRRRRRRASSTRCSSSRKSGCGPRRAACSRSPTASSGRSNGRRSASCSAPRWPTSSGCSSSWPNSRPRSSACAR